MRTKLICAVLVAALLVCSSTTEHTATSDKVSYGTFTVTKFWDMGHRVIVVQDQSGIAVTSF